jgi:hypothetical protein
MVKLDWLAAGVLQREVGVGFGHCSLELAYSLCILSAKEKQEMAAYEIFYTFLTNKKQRKPEEKFQV